MEELSLIDFIEGMQPEKAKVAKPEIPELTVSEISFEIKRFVETAFGKVRVRGEIFGAKRADSGLIIFRLKMRTRFFRRFVGKVWRRSWRSSRKTVWKWWQPEKLQLLPESLPISW